MQFNTQELRVRSIYLLTFGLLLINGIGMIHELSAQIYYPDNIGNEWIFLSTDGIEKRTLRIQANTNKDYRLLIDQTKEVNPPQEETGYSRFIIQPETDSIKIVQATFTFGLVGEIDLPYIPPQVFLPIPIQQGSKWTVTGSVKLPLLGQIQAQNHQEVISVETISVPAGKFKNCLKIKQNNVLDSPVLGMELAGIMWLAPDLGPVKLVNSGDVVFELIRHNIKQRNHTIVSTRMKLATKWAIIRK